jgi:hypothetical protein
VLPPIDHVVKEVGLSAMGQRRAVVGTSARMGVFYFTDSSRLIVAVLDRVGAKLPAMPDFQQRHNPIPSALTGGFLIGWGVTVLCLRLWVRLLNTVVDGRGFFPARESCSSSRAQLLDLGPFTDYAVVASLPRTGSGDRGGPS